MSRFLCLFLLSISLAACGSNFVYEETHRLAAEGWPYGEELAFGFDISDTAQLYNLHLVLEHSTRFDYQNMYVKIQTRFPNGEVLEEQVSLELADKFGRWSGKCRGEQCKLPIVIQQKAYFNQVGEHKIAIAQWTRTNPLLAIQSLGFKLEALPERRGE